MKTDDRLIYLISRARHRLYEHLKARFRQEKLSISPEQTALLIVLKKRNPQAMTELSTFFSVDKSSMTGMIDRLEKKGYVARLPDPGDRRKNLITLTGKNIPDIDRAIALIKETNDLIRKDFTASEMDTFKKVLSGLFEKLQKEENCDV